MTRNFKEAVEHRRTYYNITNSSPISDHEIKELIAFAVKNVPSAFNSQSTRIVLLLGKNHKKFWEDMEVVENLQKAFPSYKDNFPVWSQQTSAMHQFAIWTMLEDAGLGASLQHYNPLIDEKVQNEWKLNPNWKLIAQMPFGTPTQKPGEKEFNPIQERFFTFE